MGKTTIEWATHTLNVTTGCDKISPGCDSCYALKMAGRLKLMGSERYQTDGDPRTSGPGFGLALHPEVLEEPDHWRATPRRRVFIDSMSDLFHEEVPDWFIYATWRMVWLHPEHTFMILTKRSRRLVDWFAKVGDTGGLLPPSMLGDDHQRALVMGSGRAVMHEAMVDSWGPPPEGAARPYYDWQEGERWWPVFPPNLWIGVSIENNRYAFRANHLRQLDRAAVRFISAEPLIGPLSALDLTGIDWLLAGGESGTGRAIRPVHPDWVRDLRDRCAANGVSFLFKQWGIYAPHIGHIDSETKGLIAVDADGEWDDFDGNRHGSCTSWDKPATGGHGEAIMQRGSKHRRTLDGREWTEFPDERGES